MCTQCSNGQCGLQNGPMSGCNCQGSSCGCQSSCSCGCGSSCNCPAGDLLDTVKCVKQSLLKDKIKAKLEVQMGKHLDEVADLAVEMLMNKIEMKKEKQEKRQQMMNKLQSVMNK